MAVPTVSSDGNFVFNEVTQDFQAVTLQGQFTYRISNPQIAARLLNFSLDIRTRNHVSGDPERIVGRIANVVQMQTRGEIQSRSLEAALHDAQTLAARVLASIQAGNLLQNMGVELLQIYFVAVKPAPEMAKALEAPSPAVEAASQTAQHDFRFGWSEPRLCFSVREPFVSKISGAGLVFGEIGSQDALEIASLMPQDGVIFSDGIETDAIEFNSGAIAKIGVAQRALHLVTRV